MKKFVRGDGNCFVRSIAEIMGMGHPDIRDILVREVLNNPSDYQNFVDIPIEEWADAMKEQGTWADGLAVKATANSLNVPIVVFRKRNPDQSPTVFLPRVSVFSPDLEPICVELDEPGPGMEHYSPLMEKAALSPHKVAAPLRRLNGKQPPTNDDCVPAKSDELTALFSRMRQKYLDEEEKENRAGEPSASIQTLGDDQTIGSPSEVVPPSGDVAANIPETLEVEGDWRTETYSTDLDVMSKDPSTHDLDVMSKAPSTPVGMSPATSTPPAAQATPPSAQVPPHTSRCPSSWSIGLCGR